MTMASTSLRVALVGECMLELSGEAFGAMHLGFGGDTLNTAVYLARCAQPGALSVGYATALGDDGFSAGLLSRWAVEGLQTDWVQRLPGLLPGLYAIEVDAAGERRFSYWREAAAARRQFEAPSTPLEAAGEAGQIGCLYLSGITLAILPPAGRARLFALMQTVRARGGRVVFDNNYRPRLWADAGTARAAFEQALALCDLALITLDDHQALTGLPDADAALAHALALTAPEVVVKRGAAATLVRLAGEPVLEVPVQPVKPVDTTAAGDSFAAGYLSRRLTGGTPAEAAAFGNRLAGRVIGHRGALIPREAMADLMAG
jgi:2-dehydro-3-deoxygluconokinase